MDAKHLRCIVALADEDDFSKASIHLGIQERILARRIKQLENEYRTTLLQITKGRAQLTDIGEKVVEDAREILDLIDRDSCSIKWRETGLRSSSTASAAETWVTQAEAARIRGVSRQAIGDLVKRRRVPILKIAGRVLLRSFDVRSYKTRNKGKRNPSQMHNPIHNCV